MREGLTVIARFGKLPPLGQIDVTLEALVYGAVLGLRALIVIACFALHSAAVDPDELLRAFRRLSFRSALTAALATRMVPVLARDARRMRDAQRCRPGSPRRGCALARAVDRGRAGPRGRRRRDARGARLRRRPRGRRGGSRPWSRHDFAFAAAALALAALAIAAARRRLGVVRRVPALGGAGRRGGARARRGAARRRALLPFADRRGIGR